MNRMIERSKVRMYGRQRTPGSLAKLSVIRFALFIILFAASWGMPKAADSPKVSRLPKIPCYAWLSEPHNEPGRPSKPATDKDLEARFADLKRKGIDGVFYSAGHDRETYRRIGRIVKAAGLEFQAWIPTLIQQDDPKLKHEWYAINGLGESAYDKPAYVSHYKFLCPNREEVYLYLADLYGSVAEVPEVDGIHLDFIRFPDVILARGLWKKYGLVMDREYPQFDYCYCDKCVSDFKAQTGLDIRSIKDPSKVEAWKQFRFDLITKLVNRLGKDVRSKGKRITAAVFPGPNSVAKKIVRQEWDKWDLDAFFPMNYNDFYLEGTKWIGAMCKEAVTALANRRPVFSGLFICPDPANKAREPDPEYHGLLPEELEAAIRESMDNGAAGICLFTPDRMTEAHWAVFENAIHGQSHQVSAAGEEAGKNTPSLAFIHVNVIPMDAETVLPDQTVLVQGERIVSLGPSEATSIPGGAAVIDGSGLFLLPGLTDAHVHLDQEIGARPDFGDAPLFLAYGVTTVFNLRGEPQHLEWKRQIQEGRMLAPNLYNAGEFVNEPRVNTPEEAEREVQSQLLSGYDIIKFREVIDFKDWRVLTTEGLEKQAYLRLNKAARRVGLPLLGHAPYRVGLAGLLQARQSLSHMNELANLYFLPPLSLRAKGSIAVAKWSFLFLLLLFLLGDAARLMVRIFRRTSKPGSSDLPWILNAVGRLAALAAVCILLWILVVPPGRLFGQVWLLLLLSAVSILYLAEIFRFLRRLISALRKRTVTFLAGVLGSTAWLAAFGLAVCLVRWVPFAWRGSDLMMNRVSRELKKPGVWIESTLVLYETGMGTRDGFRYEQRIQDPAFRCLAVPLQEQWKKVRQMLPPWMVKVWARHPEFTRKLMASFHRAGGSIVAGTDALGVPFIIPGASLHQELQLLKESGLSPYEVIRAATVAPARFLGKEAEFGKIAAGQRADLVLVETNPLQDLGSLRKLRGVMVRGSWLPKEKLAEMLAGMISQ